jgi:hypothetical protein
MNRGREKGEKCKRKGRKGKEKEKRKWEVKGKINPK